jgi:hemerythrin superfamily protein
MDPHHQASNSDLAGGLHSAPLVADALAFLEDQHLVVNQRFEQLDETQGSKEREDLFRRLADALAIHTTIEEQHFYPAIRSPRTENLLIDSLREHLEIKRALVDLVQLPIDDQMFDEKVSVLRQLVTRHIQADEAELFPLVRRTFSRADLLAVAEAMQGEVSQLEGTDPRFRVFPEAVQPASL